MSDTKLTKEEREEFIKKMEEKTAKQGLSLPEYVVKTGGERMREIMLRMIKSELAKSYSVNAKKF